MEKKIERDISGNYIVLECTEINYKIRMLESNRIQGLLPLRVQEENGNKKLYYDISSRICLDDVIAARSLGAAEIRTIVYSVSRILWNAREHLLSASDLVLAHGMVYVKTPKMEPSICCVPGYDGDFAAEFSSFLRELLGAVDQRDKDAVVLTYSLYQESLKENYVMEDILNILRCDSLDTLQTTTVRSTEAGVVGAPPELEEVDLDEPDADELYEFLKVSEKAAGKGNAEKEENPAKSGSRKRRKKFFVF